MLVFSHEKCFSLQSIVAGLKKVKELEDGSTKGKIITPKQVSYLELARKWKYELAGDCTMYFLEWRMMCALSSGDIKTPGAILKLASIIRPNYDFMSDYLVGTALGLEQNEDMDYDPKDISRALSLPENGKKICSWLQTRFEDERAKMIRYYASIPSNKMTPIPEERSALDEACDSVAYRDLWGNDIRVKPESLIPEAKRDCKDFN